MIIHPKLLWGAGLLILSLFYICTSIQLVKTSGNTSYYLSHATALAMILIIIDPSIIMTFIYQPINIYIVATLSIILLTMILFDLIRIWILKRKRVRKVDQIPLTGTRDFNENVMIGMFSENI